MVSHVQAVLFPRDLYTRKQAEQWLRRNSKLGKPMKKVEVTKKYLHYRLYNPKLFKRFRNKKLADKVELVIGFY